VESVQLSQFFNQVTGWPKSQSEMDEVADKIGRLLEASVVVVISNQSQPFIGMKTAEPLRLENINREGLADFLRNQIKQYPGDSNQIKRIQLSGEGNSFAIFSSVHNLTYARLTENVSKVKKDFGSIVVGSSKSLGPKEELVLLAVAQRLSELARITELEADIQIRNQFLSIASHELKTPLTSIYGILQLQERMLRLKKDQTPFPDQERHHNFLKMVIRQTERLNELIDGLLDVSRIQNGRFMVEPLDTDVATLLKEAAQTRLSVIAQEAGVTLNVDTVPNLVAWVDPVRMEEVINNLVMNAIRFSPEGGVVWIRLRSENGAFRMTVRDQGPSIPMEDRERIFQPFERAQRTSRMGGLGLGLFISRQIAQLHGGNVSLVESIPGKGNVFEAYFPIRQSQLSTVSA
jgi:signal transduction histidine kinase